MNIRAFARRTLQSAVLATTLIGRLGWAVEPAPTITATQALAAYDRFKAAPEANLQDAPTFLKFMQNGAVHTVLNSKVVFWMYRDVPRDVQAVLYAAYMGGNLDSQLRTRQQGDDPEAGMRAALSAYEALKKTHAKLALPELDALRKAQSAGALAPALAKLAEDKP
ncbi:MAG: hypothetical protein HYX63_21015 [Gammaproteobacteria bacterium]|nr:hypothetical protein [Gammaproteobacteria bacterium]